MSYKEEETQKRYYSIGEVAKLFDVNPSLIRFWENEFDVLQPKKNKKESSENAAIHFDLFIFNKYQSEYGKKNQISQIEKKNQVLFGFLFILLLHFLMVRKILKFL